MLPSIRIFVSSPGDVYQERIAAERVIKRIRDRYASDAIIVPVLWEHEPITANHSYQPQIDQYINPADCDIVVFLLWARLGTPIVESDGKKYPSGTVKEFWTSFEKYQQDGSPDILIYKKTSTFKTERDDAEYLKQVANQKDALEKFMAQLLTEQGLPKHAYLTFEDVRRFEETFEVHIEKMIERKLYGETTLNPTWQGNPYLGLKSFDLHHAPVYFGREVAVLRALEQLSKRSADGISSLLIVGGSGSGKSSLARSGLTSRIISGNSDMPHVLIRPGMALPSSPISYLAQQIERAIPSLIPFRIGSLLEHNPGAVLNVMNGVRSTALRRDESNSPQLLMIIDQIEELFTLGFDQGDQRKFAQAIDILSRSGLCWCIATLRSDYFARLSSISEFGHFLEKDGVFALQAPTKAEIGQMIRRPARAAGLYFEENRQTGQILDEVIRDETGDHAEVLPLLEFTLDELYLRRSENGQLTFDAYREIGGIEGSVAKRAEEVFRQLTPEVRQSLSKVFRQLVTVSIEDGIPSKQRCLDSSFDSDPSARKLVDSLVEGRLLSRDQQQGETYVEIVHEALLKRWPPIVDWLSQEGELLRMRSRLSESFHRWKNNGKRKDLLLPAGKALEEGNLVVSQLYSGSQKDKVEAADYVQLSNSAAQIRTRIARGVMIALGALVLIASSAGLIALNRGNQLETAVGDLKEKSTDLQAALDKESELLRKESELRNSYQDQVIANSVLRSRDALEQGRQDLAAGWLGYADSILASTKAPESERLAFRLQQAQLLDSQPVPMIHIQEESPVRAAYRNSDGTRLLIHSSPSNELRVRCWDTTTGELIFGTPPLSGKLPNQSIAFSPNGKQCAIGYSRTLESSVVEIWDIDAKTRIGNPKEYPGMIKKLQYSKNGKRLAYIADGENTDCGYVIALDMSVYPESGSEIQQVRTGSPVWQISFDDEMRFANIMTVLPGKTGNMRILDLSENKSFTPSGFRSESFDSSTISPDGQWLAAVIDGGLTLIPTQKEQTDSDERKRNSFVIPGDNYRISFHNYWGPGEYCIIVCSKLQNQLGHVACFTFDSEGNLISKNNQTLPSDAVSVDQGYDGNSFPIFLIGLKNGILRFVNFLPTNISDASNQLSLGFGDSTIAAWLGKDNQILSVMKDGTVLVSMFKNLVGKTSIVENFVGWSKNAKTALLGDYLNAYSLDPEEFEPTKWNMKGLRQNGIDFLLGRTRDHSHICRIDYSKDQDPIVSVENQLTKLRSQFSIASKEILPNYCVFMNNKADSMLLLSDRICFSSNIDTVSQVALLQGKEAGLRRELRKFFHPASQPTKILPAKMISSNQWDIDLSNIISLPGPVTFTFTKREQEAGVFFGMNLAASKGFLAVVDCKDSDPKIIPVECARYIDIVSDDNCTTFVGLRVDGLVDAFRITDEKPEMILESLGDSCSAVAISNDAKTLAFGNALGVLSRIDLSSPKLVINDTNLHRGRISCINIANGIGILSGDDSGELVFQDSKNEVQWRERIGAAVSDLRIDPTGNLAAVGFVQGTSDFSDFQRRAVEKHDLIVVELANGMPLPVKPINSFSVESNVGVPWFLRRHFSAIRGISWAENGFGLSWNFDERSPENGAFWRDGFAADTMWGDTSRDFSNELSSKFGINWNPAKGVYRDWTLSNVKGDEGWRNLTKVCRCIREQRVIDADLKAAVDYAISKMESGLLVELDDYLFKEKLLPECVLVRKALAEANTKDIKMQIRLVQVSNRFDPEVSLQRLGVLLDSIKDSKNIQVRADALAAKLQLVIALNQLDKFDESLSIKQEFYRSPFLAGYRQDDEVMPDIQARFGLTHLALGDFEAHRNMCTEMNARLAKKCLLDHPIRFLVQTAVCKPDAIDNWSSVADIAESFYSDQAAERDPRSFYIVGAANLRAGRFDKAFESLASCREAMGNWKAEKGKAHPFEVSLLLGILAHKKGDLALAKMELERSEKEFESAEAEAISKGSKYFLSWEQRLNFKLLRQELQDSLATN